MRYEVLIEDSKQLVEFEGQRARVNGNDILFDHKKEGKAHLVYIGEKIHRIQVLDKHETILTLAVNGKIVKIDVKDEIKLTLERLGINGSLSTKQPEILAPMPGVILDVLVKEGQEVKKGDPLVILEAMKMENLVKASSNEKVKSLEVTKGQNVEKNSVLLTFD